MASKSFTEHDLESKDFVRLLKSDRRLNSHKEAWRLLIDAYETQINNVIISTLISANLSLELVDYVKDWVWAKARDDISSFEFTRRGCIFAWLCGIHRDLIQIYTDVDSDEFINLLKTQDHYAWNRLVTLYQQQLIYIGSSRLTALGLPIDSVHDLLSSTWQTAQARVDNLEFTTGLNSNGRVFAWLCKIQEHHTLNHWRWLKVRDHLSFEDEYDAIEGTLDRGSPRPLEDELDTEEQRRVLRRAIARVLNELKSPVERDIVYRRLMLDQRPRDIVDLHNINPPSKVYELTRRAKERLKVVFMEYWLGQDEQHKQGGDAKEERYGHAN